MANELTRMTCWLKRSNNLIFLIPFRPSPASGSPASLSIHHKDVFNAFRFTELGDVKVVILGGILITDRDRRMVWHFPFVPALPFLRHY